MKNPLVSIVVPSYNHGHFLQKTIESVLSQSYENWELIIVDNNSIDNTDKVLSGFSDKRISITKIDNHGIVAKSRNRGVEFSNGEWIAFLDSDDGWHPEKLSKCLEFAGSADVIYHNMNVFRADEKKMTPEILKSRKLSEEVFEDLLLNGNTIINSTVLVRKKILEKVNGLCERQDIIAVEDYHLWLRIAKISNKFKFINEQLGYYTIHGNGLSQRDTSSQLRNAIIEFVPALSQKEYGYVESFIRYSKIRLMVHGNLKGNFWNDVSFCLKNGTLGLKLKVIFSFFQLFYLNKQNGNNAI